VSLRPRKTIFPEDFVKRFTDLFPLSEAQYASANRRLAGGWIDEIARFLLAQNVKFTAQQIRDARQDDGTLTPEFNNQVDRICAICELYDEVMQMLRDIT